jgi:hypothetical protein
VVNVVKVVKDAPNVLQCVPQHLPQARDHGEAGLVRVHPCFRRGLRRGVARAKRRALDGRTSCVREVEVEVARPECPEED